MAKTLWLNYMLIAMYIVPFFLWREKTLAPATRSLFGCLFASFALRAPIELWIIFFTRGWRCAYGITHDLLTCGLLVFLRWRMSPEWARGESAALRVMTLLQITLFVEIFMAWEFSKLASPAEGIYFAANTPHFGFLNLASWIAVAIGYPDLVSIVNTTINQTGQAIEGISIIMLVYLTISLAISGFMNWYNRRFALRGSKA